MLYPREEGLAILARTAAFAWEVRFGRGGGDLYIMANTTVQLDLVERLAAIPYAGAVTDILDEMGLTNQVLPHEIQCIVPGGP